MRRTYPCYINVSARQGQRFQNHLKAQATAFYADSKEKSICGAGFQIYHIVHRAVQLYEDV